MKSTESVEANLILVEERIVAFFTNLPRTWAPATFMLLFGSFFYFIIFPMAAQHSPFQLRPELFNQRAPLFLPIAFGALIAPYFSPRFFRPFLLILTFVAWQTICWFKFPGAVSPIGVPLYFIFVFFILTRERGVFPLQLLKSFFLICAFFALGFWLAKEAAIKNNTEVLRLFWTIHPQFYLLFALSWLFFSVPRRDLQLSLHPINLTWGTLWPQETTLASHSRDIWGLWWQGFYNCLLGSLLFFIVFGTKILLKTVALSELSLICYHYLYFIIYLVASFNLFIGFARMLRVQCPDATHFLIFAKTPMAVWQRGSTYLYQFFLRFIFLPIYRKFRNYFLTIVICLFLVVVHMFLFHDIVVRNLYSYLVPELMAPSVPIVPVLVFSFSWALLWFTWIFVGSTLWHKALLKSGTPRVGWISVIATHIVSASIHPIASLWLTPYFLKILN